MKMPSMEELKENLLNQLEEYVYIEKIIMDPDEKYFEIHLDKMHGFFISIDDDSAEIYFDDCCIWFLFDKAKMQFDKCWMWFLFRKTDKYIKNSFVKGSEYNSKPISALYHDMLEEIKQLTQKNLEIRKTYRGKTLIVCEVFVCNDSKPELIYSEKFAVGIFGMLGKRRVESNVYQLRSKK